MAEDADYWDIETILSEYKEDGHSFERLVKALYCELGFECVVSEKGPDGGIDITANKGSEKRVIQAKRYASEKIGVKDVGYLVGAAVANGAQHAELVTLTSFTKSAKKFTWRVNAQDTVEVRLISGSEFVDRLNEYNV